ncbi:hypothetical protein D3C75_1118410 [compost metagenome]
MAEDNEIANAKMLAQRREPLLRLVLDKAQAQAAGVDVGAAKAQAIVGDYPVPGGLRKLRRELAPQGNATQRIV